MESACLIECAVLRAVVEGVEAVALLCAAEPACWLSIFTRSARGSSRLHALGRACAPIRLRRGVVVARLPSCS